MVLGACLNFMHGAAARLKGSAILRLALRTDRAVELSAGGKRARSIGESLAWKEEMTWAQSVT